MKGQVKAAPSMAAQRASKAVSAIKSAAWLNNTITGYSNPSIGLAFMKLRWIVRFSK